MPAFICPWLLAEDRQPQRSYRTDLDSFFWCFLYCATFAGERNKTASVQLNFLNEKKSCDDLIARKNSVLSPSIFDKILAEFHPDFQTPRFQTLIRGFAKEVSILLQRWHYRYVDEDEPAVDFETMCDLHQKIAALIKSCWSTDDEEELGDEEVDDEEVDDEEVDDEEVDVEEVDDEEKFVDSHS